ncbi:sulfite exporter TauE/SafE family protein [Pedobacter changchengzhani]|uniref:Probable membrane transporter protein n=1 Tax=Pedobacter changchengzhani TaxID=2529274 RepID=A0A4R5MIU7_9SPHI|nr:sulfite exporter TauE/SafE family protein [Pedobacter changchengzhani]TDG35557.1 sulfite exporter TauE/SafE family protein [Pedobacter changchengzhani]
MEVAGYISSIFIGIALGLIGGGGSILTVPVLVYIFKIDTLAATAYSLFIVGATSIVGSISYFKKQLVNFKTVLVLGIPSIFSVFLTRWYILPTIPQEIFRANGWPVTKNILLMILFALLMIFASYSMIKKDEKIDESKSTVKTQNYQSLFIKGIFIGLITGLIGAGGGFLIIPVLVKNLKLSMKMAVGTSLVIISINSLAGFLFSLSHFNVEWIFAIKIASLAILGILIGSYLSTKINGEKLKPAFGWFVLTMGIYIIVKETIIK